MRGIGAGAAAQCAYHAGRAPARPYNRRSGGRELLSRRGGCAPPGARGAAR